MGGSMSVVIEEYVARHFLSPGSDLVHIVPDPRHPQAGISFDLLPPPGASFFTGEVREVTPSGPYFCSIRQAVGIFQENILFQPALISGICFLYLDAGVDAKGDLKAHFTQAVDHCFGIRETLVIPGE